MTRSIKDLDREVADLWAVIRRWGLDGTDLPALNNLAVAGRLYLGSRVWLRGYQHTLHNGQKVQIIPDIPKPNCLVFVLCQSDASWTLEVLRGGGNVVQEVFDPTPLYSNTEDNANTVNVYYSSARVRYELQNNRGALRDIDVVMLGNIT